MIELNLTYEESKKILELKYDFTSICRDFELHEEGEITKFVLVERHDDGLVSLWDCSKHEAYIYSTKCWWITPIIPKAALEACLPEYGGYEHDSEITYTWAGYTAMKSVCFIDECTSQHIGIDEYLYRPKSAYEAFVWCHENYPEELKKKFDEVMG